MYLIMHPNFIENNWDLIKNDPDNPAPETTSPKEWIEQANKGMQILGAEVVFQKEIVN